MKGIVVSVVQIIVSRILYLFEPSEPVTHRDFWPMVPRKECEENAVISSRAAVRHDIRKLLLDFEPLKSIGKWFNGIAFRTKLRPINIHSRTASRVSNRHFSI